MRCQGLIGDQATQEAATLKAEVRDRIMGQLIYFVSAMGLLALAVYAGLHWHVAIATPIACLPLALAWCVHAAALRHRTMPTP